MRYSHPILRIFLLLALRIQCLLADGDDVAIQLKGGSTLEGKLLAEKRDQLVIDVGYTVLLIPRSEITQVQQGHLERDPSNDPTEKDVDQAAHGSGLYFESSQELEDQSVVALTKNLGPAVA